MSNPSFSALEKVALIKRHLVEKEAVSDLCAEKSVATVPTIIQRIVSHPDACASQPASSEVIQAISEHFGGRLPERLEQLWMA